MAKPPKLNESPQTGDSLGMLILRAKEVIWEHARAINRLRADSASLTEVNNYYNVQAVAPYRANISGAVTIDLEIAASNNLHLTLVGNVTSFALTNPADGAAYNIRLIQDGTGGRTFAGFPSTMLFDVNTVFTFNTTAGRFDFVSLEWGETEGSYAAAFNRQMTAM